jgi:chitodextrinase
MTNRFPPRLALALATLTLAIPGIAGASGDVFADGFENGSFSSWTKTVGAVSVQSSTVRSGSFASRMTPAGTQAYIVRSLGTGRAELYARVWFRVESRSTASSLLRFARSDKPLLGVGLQSDGRVFLRNSTMPTAQLAEHAVTDSAWHELEVHIRVGDAGRSDVWLDGEALPELGTAQSLGAQGVTALRVGEDVRDRTSDIAYDDVDVSTTFIPPADHDPPTTPSDLVAEALGSTRAHLSWTGSTDDTAVAGYTIYRDGSPIGVTPDLTFTDSQVSPSTHYDYSIDAFDAAGHRSTPTDVVGVDVPSPDTTPPDAPSGLTGFPVSPTTVELAWSTAFDDRGVEGYSVIRDGDVIATTAALTFTDAGAIPEASHAYAVDAFDADGNHSPASDPAIVEVPPDTTPPEPPSGLAATAVASDHIDLAWSAATDDVGVEGYTVYRNGDVAGTTTELSFSDMSPPAPGQHVIYVVDAFDAKGFHSGPSNAVEVDVPDGSPPSTPSGLAVGSVSSARVELTWTASTDDVAVAGYTVYRNGNAIGSTEVAAYADDTVSPSTTYRYRVDAFDAAGNRSARTGPLRVHTPSAPDDSPPSVPTSLRTIAVSSSRIDLDWASSSDDTGVEGYTVYRNDAPIDSTTVSSYTDDSVTPGATYRYRVDAFDPAGNHSDRSAELVVDVPPTSGGEHVVMAAGDIACDPNDSSFNGGNGTSGSCRQKATSDLLLSADPDAVLPLGDIQYNCGGYQAFLRSFDLSWGRLKAVTYPTVGNHEYDTSGGTDCSTSSNAGGYFQYFGSRAGQQGKGWYSFDVGAWHLISLNSECSKVGGCGSGSDQERWLRADLAAHPSQCTLAFWHRPRYAASSGDDTSSMSTLWNVLAGAHADIVLAGHVHSYARLKPLNGSGQADPDGIRSWVVGTGGKSLQSASSSRSIVDKSGSDYGVLKLTLRSNGYDWRFMPAPGETLTDAGSGSCH